MASKRKQDEKSTRQLRELVALPSNKHCFDCHQRGPTYVNMTIGSFVCTSCSGILRGLNPPHRAKSISMAIFTPEEVEMVRQRGNEYCRKVWLGLYDGDTRFDGNRDEHQMKEFLPLKYEKKRWYVSPSEIARQQSILDSQKTGGSGTSAGGTSPTQTSSGYASNEGSNSLIDTAISPPTQAKNAVPTPFTQSVAKSGLGSLNVSTSNQLVDPFGGDPFGSPVKESKPVVAPQAAVTSPAAGNFANFENFANFDAFSSSPQATALPPPLSATSQGVPKSATMPFSHPPTAAPPVGPPPAQSADRYSALAELDGLFTTQATVSSTPPKPSHFGGTLAQPAGFGHAGQLNQSWSVQHNAQQNMQQQPAFSNVNGSHMSSSMNAGVPKSNTLNTFNPPPTAAFGAASNPFLSGGGANSNGTPGSGGWPAQANPFGDPPAAPSQPNPFSAPPGSGFAPIGGPPAAHFGGLWGQQVLPNLPNQTNSNTQWNQNQQFNIKQNVNPFMGAAPSGTSNGTGGGTGGGNWNPFL